jgi:hypothetical protein
MDASAAMRVAAALAVDLPMTVPRDPSAADTAD